ncbi:MAG: hypothetical protein ACRD2W_17960 [Acidimicrobiales bacterium]
MADGSQHGQHDPLHGRRRRLDLGHLLVEVADDGALEGPGPALLVGLALMGQAGERAQQQLDPEGGRGPGQRLGRPVTYFSPVTGFSTNRSSCIVCHPAKPWDSR